MARVLTIVTDKSDMFYRGVTSQVFNYLQFKLDLLHVRVYVI